MILYSNNTPLERAKVELFRSEWEKMMEDCSYFAIYEATVEVASKFIKAGQYFKILSGANGGGPSFSAFIDPVGDIFLSSLWGNMYLQINSQLKRKVVDFILHSLRWGGSEELSSLSEVGFTPDPATGKFFHPDGWYSSHPWGFRVPLPEWGGEEVADSLRIREGVLVTFKNGGGIRLIPPREYFYSLGAVPPKYRQGDLLVYKGEYPYPIEGRDEDTCVSLGRHRVIFKGEKVNSTFSPAPIQGRCLVRAVSVLRVEHPEHEELVVPPGTYEIGILIGTSRPFRRGDTD